MIGKLIIVLGYTLSQNCTIQPILQSRLDKALSVYQSEDKILVCGKTAPKCLGPRCEKISQAEVMKQYLIQNGILAENIIKEEKSTTTFGNAFYSLEFIQEQSLRPILIVANEFHCPIIKYSFSKVLGNNYSYTFEVIPDSSLNVSVDEIEKWKNIGRTMISTYDHLLFIDVKDGDIEELKSIIQGPVNPLFSNYMKDLLKLDDSVDVRELICG